MSLAAPDELSEIITYGNIVTTWDEDVEATINDAQEHGATTDHVSYIISITAKLIADIDPLNVPQCLADNKTLLLDYAWKFAGVTGYLIYINTGSVGEPLDDEDFDIFLGIYLEADAAWRQAPIDCSDLIQPVPTVTPTE